jgi:hypothetical protein
MFAKPMVGIDFGLALINLVERMSSAGMPSARSLECVIKYVEEQGYSNCSNNPEIALGILAFAEKFHDYDLWKDSFAHCTGMANELHKCSGYEVIYSFLLFVLSH